MSRVTTDRAWLPPKVNWLLDRSSIGDCLNLYVYGTLTDAVIVNLTPDRVTIETVERPVSTPTDADRATALRITQDVPGGRMPDAIAQALADARADAQPDNALLAGILRRFLTPPDPDALWNPYASTHAGDLIIDGRIDITDEELAAVNRLLYPDGDE